MSTRVSSVWALGAMFVCQTLAGQAPTSTSAEQPPVIRTTAREVLVDLVVRDKHHHAVTDLRPEEVEVYEDGVRQNVKVFRGVQGAEELQAERKAAQSGTTADKTVSHPELAHPVNTLRQVNFISVVFAQIAPLNLEFAREAVLEFLKSDTLPNTYVTVYRLDRNLKVIQPYTSDKDSLAKAVDAAAKGLHSQDGLDVNAAVVSGANTALQATAATILATPGAGPADVAAAENAILHPLSGIASDPLWIANAASQDVSIQLGNALLAQAHLETGLRFVTSRVDGMDAMDALRQLVRSQDRLPGRKVVLYLADALAFPINQRDVVDNLISFANRSGVSFYTIDTRGLNAEDPMMRSLVALQRAGAESAVSRVDPKSGHREDDDVQLTAVSNSQLSMRELAESTGGFAVINTNEIAAPMQHIMEDIRTHYELAYTPTSTRYDGHFRKIEVKITRPKVTVQTRKGYFALPELNGEPLQPFEAAALNAINARPAPVEFPYQIALMQFRPKQNAVEYEMAFEVPLSALKSVADPKTGKSRFHAALVALIHDGNGEIISKVSRDLAREVSTTDLALVANDRILYAEPLELPAGHYVIDTAVTDEQAEKTAVKRVSVFVDPGKNLGVSSLEVIERFDALPGPRNPQNPFELKSGRVTPSLADSIASGKPVRLYFVVYPAKAATSEDPKVTLQVFQDGKEVGRQPLDLPKPEADGSIPVLMQLAPVKGQCDILVTAQQGTLVAQSRRSVKIE